MLSTELHDFYPDAIQMEVPKCQRYIQSKDGMKRCAKPIAPCDPEGIFCSTHRVCVFIQEEPPEPIPKPPAEKWLDFETFRASLLN